MSACDCIPEVNGYSYNPIIAKYFHDCIYSPADYVAVVLGWTNIALFMFALFPQIVRNYQLKTVDALSPGFVAQWLLGDIFNLLGCIFGNQYFTQTALAIYFCATDLVLFFQVVYYSRKHKVGSRFVEYTEESKEEDEDGNPLKEKLLSTFVLSDGSARIDEEHAINSPGPIANPVQAGSRAATFAFGFVFMSVAFFATQSSGTGTVATGVARTLLGCINASVAPSRFQEVASTLTSWASGILYVGSRIPQLLKNYQRKSIEGLAIGMFMITLAANLMYGFSIILRFPTIDTTFYQSTLAFIFGSMGTVLFDVLMFLQYLNYRHRPLKEEEEENNES